MADYPATLGFSRENFEQDVVAYATVQFTQRLCPCIKDAGITLETNGNGRNRNKAKLLNLRAGDRDRTGDVQLGKLYVD